MTTSHDISKHINFFFRLPTMQTNTADRMAVQMWPLSEVPLHERPIQEGSVDSYYNNGSIIILYKLEYQLTDSLMST